MSPGNDHGGRAAFTMSGSGGSEPAALVPYHEGERSVQERAGAGDAAAQLGRIISPVLGRGPRLFLASVSLTVVGSADDDGHCWASMIRGEPGFLQASATAVQIRGMPPGGDPIAIRRPGDAIGLLALDLGTARRYRVNGRVLRWGPRAITVAVEQAYGNCPRFMRRQDHAVPGPPLPPAHESAFLKPAHQQLIERSDRMFVATRHPAAGADASHKGGPPGFVRIVTPTRLRFPDYPGNNMFNTLGNLIVSPGIGLLFHDFGRPASLQVTGTARVGFRPDGERTVDVQVIRCVYRDLDR